MSYVLEKSMHCISKVTARKESFHSENTRAIKSGVIRQTKLFPTNMNPNPSKYKYARKLIPNKLTIFFFISIISFLAIF